MSNTFVPCTIVVLKRPKLSNSLPKLGQRGPGAQFDPRSQRRPYVSISNRILICHSMHMFII